MTTINLKDFYSWYTHDEYIEVPDEVAEELKADKRYEVIPSHPYPVQLLHPAPAYSMGEDIHITDQIHVP